eukprot:1468055-Pyramimonas_sp.AAC.1
MVGPSCSTLGPSWAAVGFLQKLLRHLSCFGVHREDPKDAHAVPSCTHLLDRVRRYPSCAARARSFALPRCHTKILPVEPEGMGRSQQERKPN